MTEKVLFVRSDVKLAGPGRLMLSSAETLRDVGVEVTFATGGGEMVEQIEKSGFRHVTIPELKVENRSVTNTARAAFKLTTICRKHRFNVVHAFNAHAALCALSGAKLTGASVFNTVLGNGKENLLRRLPLRLIAVSNSVKDKLVEHGVSTTRISVIYNSTLDARFLLRDDSEFEKVTAKRAAMLPITFVSVAVFTGQKGHAQIVNAAQTYQEKGYEPPILIKLVGAGPKMDEIQAMVTSKGLDDMFEFAGASSQVEKHLDAAHIFIHLAEMETFGMVLAEAGGRGLPCIASNVGGIPEVVLDGETGFLVDRDDTGQVARRMLELAQSQELRTKLGAAGASRSKTLFSRSSMARDLLALYGMTPRPHTSGSGPKKDVD